MLAKSKKSDDELDKYFSSFFIDTHVIVKTENMTKFGEEPTSI